MKNINDRIEALPDKKRDLLARLITRDAKARSAAVPVDETTMRPPEHTLREEYDIAILGGGLAGLSMSIQLRRVLPGASILVAESKPYPATEAAHKVGESSVEIGARYYHGALGFGEHLEQRQIRKMGLRFFFPWEDNTDLAKRCEMGPFKNHVYPIPTYQIDRGRFENMLAAQAGTAGAGFVDECKIISLELGENGAPHFIQLTHRGKEHRVKARWIIDASGRGALIRRKLGLTLESEHKVNAAWIRIKVPIDLEVWSSDPAWRARMLTGYRQYSTNHLMDRGYWVWLIRLASGSTSVGIVADPRLHPLTTFNQVERFTNWLLEHEPLVGNLVREKADLIQDFIAIKHLAHHSKQAYSKNRWALIGDAALFTDPLYSLGSDFIAMGNTLVTDLIHRDLVGGDIGEQADFYNWLYLDFLYDTGIRIFQDQYPIMGNAQVMSAKIAWDLAWYWGTIGLIFFHDKIADFEFMQSIIRELKQIQIMQRKTQDFLRHWDEETKDQPSPANTSISRRLNSSIRCCISKWRPVTATPICARSSVTT
jgi:flavin-dependent dehydrogenase